jgi:hypothetical protein
MKQSFALLFFICAAAFQGLCSQQDNSNICDEPLWWDSLLRVCESTDTNEAVAYNAGVAFNATKSDPGWALYGQQITGRPHVKAQADAAGLRSLSYFETFGQSPTFVVELDPVSTSPDYNTVSHTYWSWASYSGGEVVWVGTHNWFDDEWFARPWTRTHPVYGGPAMTYPDGTEAAGYIGDPTDPRNSRVYDAGGSKDILGRVPFDYEYNLAAQASQNGQLYIPSDKGDYCGYFSQSKDTACPMWIDFTYASTLHATSTGIHGMWTDNYSPWDNFNANPVKRAFGEWSVARFRQHLLNNFTANELAAMGVSDVMTFDVREKFKDIAAGWGWDPASENLDHASWKDSRWQEEPLWQAYMIFKRRVGTEALTNYDNAVHQAASENGIDDFLVMGNDIPMFNLGWTRGNLDMVSTELTAGWSLGAGSRGITLPPFGRFAPVYKLAMQHSKSRFVNVWFYNSHYEDYLKHDPLNGYRANRNLCQLMWYEMLATHTLPMFHPGNDRETGDAATNAMFFSFVSEVESLFNKRYAVEDVGIYYSSSSILNQMLPGGVKDFNNQPHQFANWGWATALGQLHYQYRFIPEWKLNSLSLRDLKVLIIAESEVFDDSDAADVVFPWVQAGGKLIVTGSSGKRFGESGNFAVNPSGFSLSRLTGVSNIESAPAINQVNIGQGEVYYIKENIGLDYFNADNASQRAAMIGTFSTAMNEVLAGIVPVLSSTDTDVNENVGLTLYQDICAGKMFVDIVNYNIELETDAVTNTPELTFDIEMPAWLAGKEITVDIVSPHEIAPAVVNTQAVPGRIQITAPSVRVYASIIIGFEPTSDIAGNDLVINLQDYAVLASNWLNSPCYSENNWCGGADINMSNDVGIDDLFEVIIDWLTQY